MKGTSFTNCSIIAVDFMSTDLTEVAFENCDLYRSEFAKAIANPNTDLVTGRTAIDNIKLRSILCNSAKIRSFILSSESNETHFLYGIIESAFGQ